MIDSGFSWIFRGGWLWANDVSVPRKVTPGLPGWIFLYSAQASFSWPRVDLARLLRRACSRSFSITSFEFVKVCGIRFSIWESFIGFYICCYFILSRNFVGALRITTTNYRVSFIDLYLVFPRNFRIVFLPHTNTVISLGPYCGTPTEPGLPVHPAEQEITHIHGQ